MRAQKIPILIACEGNADEAYFLHYKRNSEIPDLLAVTTENIKGFRNIQKIKRLIVNKKFKACLFITDEATFEKIKGTIETTNGYLKEQGFTTITPILSKPYSIEGLLLKCLKNFSKSKIKNEKNASNLFKKEFNIDPKKIELGIIDRKKELQPNLTKCEMIQKLDNFFYQLSIKP